MHTLVISSSPSPRISFHEEDFAAFTQVTVTGISQYGLVPLVISGSSSSPRISFHEEDFISSGVAPAAVNFNLLMLMGVKT
jgi:hypothetical protein